MVVYQVFNAQPDTYIFEDEEVAEAFAAATGGQSHAVETVGLSDNRVLLALSSNIQIISGLLKARGVA